MRGNRRALTALLLSLSLLLAGCGASSGAPAEKYRVSLVVKSTQSEFFKSLFAGANAAAAEYNLDLTISGPATEEDYEAQNTLVRRAVDGGAQALVFSAIDYEKNVSAIDEAARAGLKIVTVDSGVDSSSVSSYIGTDNYAAGRQAARAALSCGCGRLVVGLINYDVNSANGQERERGVRDALDERDDAVIAEGINVLASADNAMSGALDLLRRHPEINVLIAFNEPTSVGAARAVAELRRADDVWLVGFDSNVETVDFLQNGVVDALVVQNPYAMGYLGVEAAYRLLSGYGAPPASTVDTSTRTVNLENLFTPDSQRALFAFQ